MRSEVANHTCRECLTGLGYSDESSGELECIYWLGRDSLSFLYSLGRPDLLFSLSKVAKSPGSESEPTAATSIL